MESILAPWYDWALVFEQVAIKRRTGRSCENVTTQQAIEHDISDYLISPHPKRIHQHIKKKIFARGQKDWYAEQWDDRQRKNGNKQRTYRLHKDRLQAEDYLNEKMSRYKRKVLSRLRCGKLPLALETWRYSKPQKPLEEHFLHPVPSKCNRVRRSFFNWLSIIWWPAHNTLHHLQQKWSINWQYSPSIIKYITLMTSKHQHQLSNIVFNMYQRRKLFSVY